jgi:hypothetical protein
MRRPSFLIKSFRASPGLPVWDRDCGSCATEDRKSSSETSIAESAVDRASACEKAYRASRVSVGKTAVDALDGRE